MRLTKDEKTVIQKVAEDIFGNAEVYLFGSRVDDSKKGGDIDLYIIPEQNGDLLKKKIQFLISLKKKIGDQKIDVIVSEDPEREIEKEARCTGVRI